MCGICGIAYCNKSNLPNLSLIKNMCIKMVHRGPDEQGIHLEPGIALGFQRLGIVDRQGGHQPLTNEDKSLWLVCNGEIYNYVEIRKYLQGLGHTFNTNSDAEVILHLYEEEGEKLFSRLRGMFAFALWDSKKKQLMLARDRMGIKPLYFTVINGNIFFASEIKALLVLPEVKAVPDTKALHSYLTYRFVPAPDTLFKGIQKLQPAHYLIYRAGRAFQQRYWNYLDISQASCSEEEYTEELLHLLQKTVELHLQSEVPVGVFLSSGIDSASILALASQTGAKLNTYTLGFRRNKHPHPNYWELSEARQVAARYNTIHREIEVSPQEIPLALMNIIRQTEEPLGDPTEIPLYFISREASQDVTVILSGEGADEVFAGYEIYLWPQLCHRFQMLPEFIRQGLLAPMAKQLPNGFPGKNFIHRATTSLPDWYRGVGFTFSDAEMFQLYSKQIKQVNSEINLTNISNEDYMLLQDLHPVNQMLYLDNRYWLPDDVLIKSDKITMANTLELRVPFLDHKVVEFAAALPANLKVHNKSLKYILKKAMGNVLPEDVINRKKIGFTAPISAWITKELRPYAEALLTSSRFLDRGYFEPRSVLNLLAASKTGSCVHTRQVYTLMVLELWHRLFIDREYENTKIEEAFLTSKVANGTH